MDYSQFSTDDLKALQAGDLSKVSSAALKLMQANAGEALPSQPGMIASAGAGLGRGVQSIALGAQKLIGKGVQAVGDAVGPSKTLGGLITGVQPRGVISNAGDWLIKDAEQGGSAGDAELAPYKAAHPNFAGGGELAGQIAATLPVGGALAIPFKAAAKFIPALEPLANAIASAGMTTGAPVTAGARAFAENQALRMLGGGAVGGTAASLVDPSSAGTGAMIGAALPPSLQIAGAAAQGLYKTAKAAAEPFFEAGKNRIVGRALTTAAGGDAGNVLERLAEASKPFVGPQQGAQRTVMGELVPGSMPTVGQAAQNPGVAALERTASATNPSVTNAVSQRLGEQNAARVGVLDEMAGGGGARDFAAANRDATALQLYGAARKSGVDSALTSIPEVQANIAGFAQRVPDEIISKAKQLAKINGVTMNDASSVQGMHWMKLAIDDSIEAAKRAGNNTLARAYTGLQKDLLTGLDNLSPDYAASRKVYADMSKPINQMDTAQLIKDRSVNALTGNVQPGRLAVAINDKTAKSATGFSGATLENTLTQPQRNQLSALLEDVQRANAAQNGGRGAGSDTVQKLAYSNILEQSGVPGFLKEFRPAQIAGNLASRAADALYGRANRELSNRLAEVMLDPKQAALAMQMAKQSTNGKPNAITALLKSPELQSLILRGGPVVSASR